MRTQTIDPEDILSTPLDLTDERLVSVVVDGDNFTFEIAPAPGWAFKIHATNGPYAANDAPVTGAELAFEIVEHEPSGTKAARMWEQTMRHGNAADLPARVIVTIGS